MDAERKTGKGNRFTKQSMGTFSLNPKIAVVITTSQLNCRGELGDGRILRENFTNSFRKLGTVSGPVGDAIVLQVHAGGIGAGIVGADDFDGPAVAGAIFLNNNDAVVGLLARSNAR